jgi:hypothetical protein
MALGATLSEHTRSHLVVLFIYPLACPPLSALLTIICIWQRRGAFVRRSP